MVHDGRPGLRRDRGTARVWARGVPRDAESAQWVLPVRSAPGQSWPHRARAAAWGSGGADAGWGMLGARGG